MAKPFSGWPTGQPTNYSSKQHRCTILKREIEELQKKKDHSVAELSDMVTQAIAEYLKIQKELDRKNHGLYQNVEKEQQNLGSDMRVLQESHHNLEKNHQNLRESHQNLEESHQTLRESHQTLRESYQNLSKTVSLILSRDFIKRLVNWRHKLVEVVEGQSVLIAFEKRIDTDDTLRKVVEDGDYEAHGGGSILEKTKLIQDHPEWTGQLLSFLDSDDQTCSSDNYQKALYFISPEDYNGK